MLLELSNGRLLEELQEEVLGPSLLLAALAAEGMLLLHPVLSMLQGE